MNIRLLDICLFFEFFVFVVEATNHANKNSFYLHGRKASSIALALKCSFERYANCKMSQNKHTSSFCILNILKPLNSNEIVVSRFVNCICLLIKLALLRF